MAKWEIRSSHKGFFFCSRVLHPPLWKETIIMIKIILLIWCISFVIGCIAGVIRYKLEQKQMIDNYVRMLEEQELLRKRLGQKWPFLLILYIWRQLMRYHYDKPTIYSSIWRLRSSGNSTTLYFRNKNYILERNRSVAARYTIFTF